ncbi:MAG: hypothetical protein M3083_20715 [Actinomycetota bacterium]|nr:hypothetical protein [Actinomycetota bacterium]
MTESDPRAAERAYYDETDFADVDLVLANDVRVVSRPAPRSTFALRLDSHTIEQLRLAAARRGTLPTQLARDWLVECLQREQSPSARSKDLGDSDVDQIRERLDGLEWRLEHASGSYAQGTTIAPAHDVDVIRPADVLAEIEERTRLTREVIERLGDQVNYELPSDAGADLLVRRGNRAWVFQFKCGPIDVIPSFNNVVSVAKRLQAQPVLVVSRESLYLSVERPVGVSDVLISSEDDLIELLESVVSS